VPLIVIFVAIIIIFLILTVIILSQPQVGESTFDYSRNFSLLSSSEKAFLETLDALFGDNIRVFAKVRLADLLRITPHQKNEAARAALAEIDATTVDFVLCNPKDLSIIGVIDLQDKLHSPDAGYLDDDSIDKAAATAQLPIVRLPAQLHYNKEEIAKILETGLKLQEHVAPRPQTGEYGNCPSCGEPLILLKAKYGDNIGKYFLGCSNYPECKYLSLLNEKELHAARVS